MSVSEKFKEKWSSENKFYSSLRTLLRIGIMKKMKDFQDLKLKWDVLLLSDVFEKVENSCLNISEM